MICPFCGSATHEYNKTGGGDYVANNGDDEKVQKPNKPFHQIYSEIRKCEGCSRFFVSTNCLGEIRLNDMELVTNLAVKVLTQMENLKNRAKLGNG